MARDTAYRQVGHPFWQCPYKSIELPDQISLKVR
jgi:hypothetical protein